MATTERSDLDSHPRAPTRDWSKGKDALAMLRDGLIVAGLLIYGVVRISEDSFYGHLGTSPEEVGLTYITTLARTATALMFVPLGVVTVIAVAEFTEVGSHRTSVNFLGGFLIATFFVTASAYAWGLSVSDSSLMVLAAISGLLVAAWTLRSLDVAEHASGDTHQRAVRLICMLFLAISLLSVAVSAFADGLWKAESVVMGHPLGVQSFQTLLPVTASCVEVVGNHDPNLTGQFIFLGQNASTMVLLGLSPERSPSLLRVPSADIVLKEVETPSEGCGLAQEPAATVEPVARREHQGLERLL